MPKLDKMKAGISFYEKVMSKQRKSESIDQLNCMKTNNVTDVIMPGKNHAIQVSYFDRRHIGSVMSYC